MSINPLGLPLLDIGRDVHGRFTKANPGGPGNPFARKVAALRKTLLDCVSEEDLKEMIEVLKEQAREGDQSAIKLILQYCVGKPEPVKDPDRMDIDEWQRLRQMRVPQEQFDKTMETIPACVASHMAQTHWPCTVQEGDGPVQHTIHRIHTELKACEQPKAPASNQPDAAPVQSSASAASQTNTANTPSEAPVPMAEQRSSAKETSKSKERREPAGRARRESHSPTRPPSPNGENERDQQRTLELIQRLYPPSQPSGQPQSKPPKG